MRFLTAYGWAVLALTVGLLLLTLQISGTALHGH